MWLLGSHHLLDKPLSLTSD